MTPTLALGQFVTALLVVGFLFISVVLVLVVLVQRPQGGGLSGAFGGASAGSSQTAFGARTGDALTIITIGIFVAFLGMSIGLNYFVGPPTASATETIGEAPPGTTQQPSPLTPTPGLAPSEQPATTTPPAGEGETAPPPTEGETTETTEPPATESAPEQTPAETGGESEPPSEGGEGSGG